MFVILLTAVEFDKLLHIITTLCVIKPKLIICNRIKITIDSTAFLFHF